MALEALLSPGVGVRCLDVHTFFFFYLPLESFEGFGVEKTKASGFVMLKFSNFLINQCVFILEEEEAEGKKKSPAKYLFP